MRGLQWAKSVVFWRSQFPLDPRGSECEWAGAPMNGAVNEASRTGGNVSEQRPAVWRLLFGAWVERAVPDCDRAPRGVADALVPAFGKGGRRRRPAVIRVSWPKGEV